MPRFAVWLGVLMIPLVVPLVAIFFAVDRAPTVAERRVALDVDVQRAKTLFARLDPAAVRTDRRTSVSFTEAELNGALGAAARSGHKVRGHAVVDPTYGLLVGISAELPLPENRIGRYLNIRATIVPSPNGLDIRRLAVGKLELPQRLVMPVFRSVVDWLAGPGKGQAAVASIRHVRTEGKLVTVVYDLPLHMARDIVRTAQTKLRGSDPQLIRVYYARVAETGRNYRDRETSLASYLVPLFRQARERSATGEPAEENRAAILALALHFGDPRIERFVGAVIPAELRSQGTADSYARLGGRHDYMEHFVTSAGLRLAAGKDFADTLGTAKEIDDSNGGSGFSFTDLAADRAGVRFAEVATASPASARRVQATLSGYIGERDFFPEVHDLPEGLTATEFRARYGDTEQEAYEDVVDEIDRRIAAIALYQ